MANHVSESDLLLDTTTYHELNIDEICSRYNTSKTGLNSIQAKELRNKYGLNVVPPPIKIPGWLCCLLSCIVSMRVMEIFNNTVPETARVFRNGNWLQMDSASLVPGDIVEVYGTERVPADLYLIECEDCIFNTSGLYTSEFIHADAGANAGFTVGSPNTALLGYLVISGKCVGIVVATGPRTVISKLIESKQWPR